MTSTPLVRICTREELRSQVGLHPLLEAFVEIGSKELFDHLIYLDLPGGEFCLLEASVESGRVAHLQSLSILPDVMREHRMAVWQAGVAWAVSQRLNIETVITDLDLPFGTSALNFNQEVLKLAACIGNKFDLWRIEINCFYLFSKRSNHIF